MRPNRSRRCEARFSWKSFVGFNIRWFCSNDSVSGVCILYFRVYTNMYNIIKTYATASFIYCTYSYSTTVLVNFEGRSSVLKVKKLKTAFELSPYFCFSSRETGQKKAWPGIAAQEDQVAAYVLWAWWGTNIRALEEVCFTVNTHISLFWFYKRYGRKGKMIWDIIRDESTLSYHTSVCSKCIYISV